MGVEVYTGLIEFGPTMFFMWFTVLILFLVLRHYFFDKVHNFMLARQQSIKDSFAHAAETNVLADKRFSEYEERISCVEEEGRKLLEQARSRGEAQAARIIEEANQRADRMLLDAQEEIQRQRQAAVTHMQQEIAGLAIYAAEKILERELKLDNGEQVLSEVMKEVGEASWKN